MGQLRVKRVGQFALKYLGHFLLKQVGQLTVKWVGQYGLKYSMGIEVGSYVISGSSIKICLVAEGEADIYPRTGPTSEWDTAAGDAVFRYSGKNGYRESPLTYNKESLLNPGFIFGLS